MRGSTHKRRDKRDEERIDKRIDKRKDECVVEGCVLSGSAPTLGETGYNCLLMFILNAGTAIPIKSSQSGEA